ncbi:MAG: FapA family protein, partial [Clostridiales bacterium]
VIPMRFFIGVSEDQMTAWGFLLPPENGGPCLEEADLLAQIKLRGICFGVDVSAILAAIAQEQWGKLIVIAQGVAAREGQDGQIVDHYARDKTIHLTETSQNFMDYKNLNWLQKIAAETTICEIIPPVPAEDGHTVLGMVLSAPVPKMPDVPAGQNTKLSEDGTALLASCDGQLSFTKGLFRIDCSLQIKDDVDNSVGNLDVFGDVSVGGNVMDGFSIRATGTITVNGLVEGAFLYAGKDIRVSLGAKGHLSGTLEAGGTIRCRYLENCTAKAGGSITAETIINSTVSSGDSIFALNGQGTIIGGKLTALKTIEAKVIGNEFNIQNTISVGIDSSQEEAAEQLKKELAILERSIDEMEKAIVYLSGKPEDSEKAVTLLPQLKLKLSVSRMSYTRKSRALEGIVAISTDCNPQIIAHMIYPVTNISIRKQKRTLQITSRMCRVYLEDGEIIVGKL